MRKFHPSKCLYATFWGIILGLVFSVFTQKSVVSGWLWICVALILCFFSLARPSLLTLICAFIAGLLFAECRIAPEIVSQTYFNQLIGKTLTLRGVISEDPDFDVGKTTLRLKNPELLSSDSNQPPVSLSGIIYVQLAGSFYDLERSDQITIQGQLGAGFGTFAGIFYRPTLKSIQRNRPGDLFARFKNWFASLIRLRIPSPESDLGLSYLLGLKSSLPDNLSDTLRIVGMTHVVVASGTHLGILVSFAKQLFGRLSRFAGLLCALLLIGAFVLVVGFTPSMTRAALVSSLTLIFGYVGRQFAPLHLISLVACLTLLISPSNIINLGWQLSFASFFGLLILAPRITKLFYGGKKPSWLASMLITSLSTSLICSPILIYNFGTFSLLSFVANLIILPTLPYVMGSTFLTGVFSFLPFLAEFLARITTFALDFHILVVNYLSTKTMFVFALPTSDPRIYIIYIPILLFLVLPFIKSHHHKTRILASQVTSGTIAEPP